MTKEEILNMEPGPELDRLVAERVMGWKRTTKGAPSGCAYWKDDDGFVRANETPGGSLNWNPSIDIAAAWEVIRRCNELGWAFELTQVGLYPKAPPEGGHEILWAVRLVRLWGGPVRTVYLEGPLPPTVCKAALLAIAGRDDAEALGGQS